MAGCEGQASTGVLLDSQVLLGQTGIALFAKDQWSRQSARHSATHFRFLSVFVPLCCAGAAEVHLGQTWRKRFPISGSTTVALVRGNDRF